MLLAGHVLVSGALNIMLTSQAFGIAMANAQQTGNSKSSNTDAEESPCISEDDGGNEFPELLNSAKELYDGLMNGAIQVESLQDSDIVMAISQQLAEEKEAMGSRRTAKLWLQYIDMVEILLVFTKASRELATGTCI